MPNENPLLLAEGVDQETPISDQEKLNASKFTPTFLESTREAAYGTTLDFMQQLTNLSAMDLPMFPDMFPKDMPRLSAEALNKQFGVNTFRDDMPEAQGLLLVELQKQKNLAMDYSGLYSDSTFLGQNLPQWVGGIGGSMTNPLNAMPWGEALPALGATTSKILNRLGAANPNVALKAANSGFVQSFVTNGMGSVIDAGVRKGLETRTGEELTWAQVLENVAAGTVIGTGFDTIGDLATSKIKTSEADPTITKETPKAPTTPPEVEAGTIATAATRFEEGLSTSTTKVREAFEPTYKEKLRIFTHEDIGESIVAPDYHVLDLENGFVEVQKVDGSGYRVGEQDFNTLEEANSYAFKNGEQIKVTDVSGTEHVIDPVDNDVVNESKVGDVAKDFDNEVEKSGHTKKEVESFEQFEDTLVPSEEYKRMEDTFEHVKKTLDEEIRSSDTPDATLVAQKEKIVEFEAKAKSEESVIKALTHCILRKLQ